MTAFNCHTRFADARNRGLSRCWLWMVFLYLVLAGSTGVAQQRIIRGKVVDASTGETLPLVHVLITGTRQGITSDLDGHFELKIADTVKSIEFSMMGYETKHYRLGRSSNIKVTLRPTAHNLQSVTITDKRTRKRYKRKNNPALELAQQVIAHKAQNHVSHIPYYDLDHYSKTNMAFDDFHPNFKRHLFWKHLPFVENYIDRTPFDNTEILNISVSETMQRQLHRASTSTHNSLTTAIRHDGIAQVADDEGMGGGPEGLFQPVDIYQNEIELLQNHFVSPLSSTLANATYHFFITDSVVIDSVQCVELTFLPVNNADYAFAGRMYVAVGDSSYAVAKYDMKVAQYANINFVKDVHLLQTYHRDTLGRYLPDRNDVYGRLSLTTRIKLFKELYLHQANVDYNYAYADTITTFPDSLFGLGTTAATLPTAYRVRRAEWNDMRPITLSEPELLVDSFRYELMRTPWARRLIHGAWMLFTGYIPTSSDFDSSRFDFGSLYNFYSFNTLEGTRLRIGGMTKALLNKRNFADGYVAFGTLDKHFKFGLNLTHTFDDKRKHAKEYPRNAISFYMGYDVETPGVAYGLFQHDNILMTSNNRMMEYVGSAQLRLERQWKNSLGLDTRLSLQRHQPVGDLSYSRLMEDGSWQMVGRYDTYEWNTNLSFVPNRQTNNSRGGGASAIVNQDRNRLVLSLSHSMGWFEHFYYNRTTFNANKILWMGPLGYMKLTLDAGKVWNQVPLPKLFFPSGTASTFLVQGAFNALTPMEFAADQYVAFYANYHLRGLIFNHLPIIRRFKLREVCSFSLYWGSLSSRNDPDNGHAGLYRLPVQTSRLTSMPYMEYSIGIENISHIIRIDYVRRLSYIADQAKPTFASCLRLGFEFSL